MSENCRKCGVDCRNYKEINGQRVLVENANYYEITIHFEDGSNHETLVCRTCAKKTIDISELQDIYGADVDEFETEDPSHEDYYAFLRAKVVESYKLGSRYIKA